MFPGRIRRDRVTYAADAMLACVRDELKLSRRRNCDGSLPAIRFFTWSWSYAVCEIRRT